MLYLNVWLTVTQSSDIAAVRQLLGEAGRLSCAEPGCVRLGGVSIKQRPFALLAARMVAVASRPG